MARMWVEDYKGDLLQMEGGKELIAAIESAIDGHGKLSVEKPIETAPPATAVDRPTGVGAAGFLQEEPGVYSAGRIGDVIRAIARGER